MNLSKFLRRKAADAQQLSCPYQNYAIYKLDSGRFEVWFHGSTNLGRFGSKPEAEKAIRAHQDRRAKDVVATPEEIAAHGNAGAAVAYGEGWHSQLRSSPYSEPELTKAWERGRKAAEQAKKFRGNSYKGGIRGQRFEPPKARVGDAISRVVTPHEYKSNVASGKWVVVTAPYKSGLGATGYVKINGVPTYVKIEGDVSGVVQDAAIAVGSIVTLAEAKPLPSGKSVKLRGRVMFVKPDGRFEVKVITPGLYSGGYYTVSASGIEQAQDGSRDYKSERGYVGKFVDEKTGKTLARSEPFISEASAKKWIADNTKALVNRGHRGFKGAVELSFYDPAMAADRA